MTSTFVPSACPHDCPSTCALEVERLDERTIGRVRGAAANSYTDGLVCAKVGRYAERVHHPDRLKTPLRRVGAKGSGKFEPISWDQALDTVAAAFMESTERHGRESVWPYFFAGTMGLVHRDGLNRLRHAMGYSGMAKTLCSTVARAGWTAGVGALRGTDPREMAESDLIVFWGGNPASTQIQALAHAEKARKTRGAKIISIDPYRNRTAALADGHLALRPGTDGALACAVMNVLFAEGFADRDYLARFTDVPERLEEHLRSRTPAWAAAITGLSAVEIVSFARLYGSTRRSFIRAGYGFTRSRNGAANMHAVSCLPAVTGAWTERGGGGLYNNGALYELDHTLIEGLDVKDPSVRVLDMSCVGAVLTGDEEALRGGPPVTAMIIQNTNPAAVAPDSNKVHAGFAREDLFVCVHEQFMTETAARADIVLPATTFLEHDDIYTGGGHTFLQVARKVIEPYAESRSNHEVVCALAQRLGAEHRGFNMSVLDIIDATLTESGFPVSASFEGGIWLDRALDFEEGHFLNGFPTPDGRFRFAPDWAAVGPVPGNLPPLPDHAPLIEESDEEHPFRLVTAPARNFLNSSFTETPTSQKREGRPTAFLHPDDCRRLGIADGVRVRLGNRRGQVVVHAKSFQGLQPGVVIVESVWPNAAFVDGLGINALTGADPVPPLGGVAFHDNAIWVRAA
jgi:anaerobic selenocysteine-containing dehydrogenase